MSEEKIPQAKNQRRRRRSAVGVFGMRIIDSEKITLYVEVNLLKKVQKYAKEQNQRPEDIMMTILQKGFWRLEEHHWLPPEEDKKQSAF